METLKLPNKEKLDLKDMYDIIHSSSLTNTPIDESVMEKFMDNSPALLLWAIKYKEARVPEIEKALAEDVENPSCMLPYFKKFPELKDGPLWDKLTTCGETALRYSQMIIQGRFEAGEEAITNSEFRPAYVDFLKRVRDVE